AGSADRDTSQPAFLRCDIREQTSKRPPRPKDCDLDWGDSYSVGVTGSGYLTCHGDTTADTSDPVLAYGKTWSAYGFSCVVATTGLTCKNGQAHGFFLSQPPSNAFHPPFPSPT